MIPLRTAVRLLTAGGIGTGTLVYRNCDIMSSLNALATLKDVAEAVAWTVGHGRLRSWEERLVEHKAVVRLVVAFVTGTACVWGQGSEVMKWLGGVASVKEVAEGLAMCVGRERVGRWQDFVVHAIESRYVVLNDCPFCGLRCVSAERGRSKM